MPGAARALAVALAAVFREYDLATIDGPGQ